MDGSKIVPGTYEGATTSPERRRATVKRYDASHKGRASRDKYESTRRGWLAKIKLDRGCIDCGYNAHPSALDFDHVVSEKLFNLSRAYHSFDSLRAELEKCVIRCANCHRIRHYVDAPKRRRARGWAAQFEREAHDASKTSDP